MTYIVKMECQYGEVAPTTSQVLNPGSDKYFVPGSGAVLDFVQMRRQNGGRMEKKSVMKKDPKKDLNVTNFVRQTNEGEKNTYFYKLRRVLPGLHDTRAGQPVGKILPGRAFKSVVGASKMPVNGNYMRRVGKGTSENNDLYRRPYEPTSTTGMGEFQQSYAAPERAFPMQGVEEEPDMMSIAESFNKTQYRRPQPQVPSVISSTTKRTPSEAPSDIEMGSGVTKPSGGLSQVASGVDKVLLGSTVSAPERGLGAEDVSMAPSVSTTVPEEPGSMYEDLFMPLDYDESIAPGDSASQYQVPSIGSVPRLNPPSSRVSMSDSGSQIGDARASGSKTNRPRQNQSVVSNPIGPAVKRDRPVDEVPQVRKPGQRRKRTYERAKKKRKKGDEDYVVEGSQPAKLDIKKAEKRERPMEGGPRRRRPGEKRKRTYDRAKKRRKKDEEEPRYKRKPVGSSMGPPPKRARQ